MKKQVKVDEAAEARINEAICKEIDKIRSKEAASKNGKKPAPKKKPAK